MAEIGVELSLAVPFGGPGIKLSGKWQPDNVERKAAWDMYVELVTRIPVAPLGPDEGLLREALSSLYSLFETTRGILKACGPKVAQPKMGDGIYSFGTIAVTVLNKLIRPVVAEWHPRLLDWEAKRPGDRSALEHEHAWADYARLRQVIDEMRPQLVDYANLLGTAANVVSLIE
jgi:hypothetical protein